MGADAGERIITSTTYDDAGRVSVETPPGSYGVLTHSYDPANRSHTVTRADGSATTETTYLDGRIATRLRTATATEYLTYGRETDGRIWKRTDVGATTSARWTKTWTDWLGREVRKERPGFDGAANIVETQDYKFTSNGNGVGGADEGHLYRSTKPGPTGATVVTRFDYDGFGAVLRSGLDLTDNGLVLASSDRINETGSVVELVGSHYWSKQSKIIYPTAGSDTAFVTSIERRRLTGHPSGRIDEVQTTDGDGNVTTVTKDVNLTTKVVTVTTTRTGVSNSQVEKLENGLSVEVTGHDGVTSTLVYDALNRPWKKIAARNGNTTETTYFSGTKLVQYVKEKANTSSPVTVSTSHYDSLGRKDWQDDAASKRTRFAYNSRDQLIKQWGAATYPVAYAYNSYGEKIAMRTFRSPSQDFTASTWPLSDDGSDANNPDPASWTSGDITRWVYDAGTGLLKEKQFAKLVSTDPLKTTRYTYNAAGQPATREWARTVTSGTYSGQRVKATYGYDAVTGEQTGITYNDGTPVVAYTYTRLGQVDTIRDATSSSSTDLRDFGYDPSYPWRQDAEVMSSFYSARALTRLYETSGAVGRVRGFKLGSAVNSNSELEQTYGYAAGTGRFETLTSGYTSNATTRTFRYGYLADSHLLESLCIDQSGGPGGHPFTITRTFETNRDVLETVETKWSTTSRTKFAYHTNNLGQRDSVEQSGDVFTGYGGSNNLIHETFAYNDRGEVTAAPTKLGAVGGSGSALSNRQHEFDYDLIGNRNWAGVTGNSGHRKSYTPNALNQISSRQNSTTPFSGTQSFVYDDDGNVTDDGQWLYTWDAENRLVAMETKPSVIGAGIAAADARRLEFKYDHQHRRVEKKVYSGWNGSAYATTLSLNRYLYDSWSLIAEYSVSGSTLSLVRSYTWGLDIARSLTDAGGVGALLQIHDYADAKDYLPAYDGNGNVTALFDANNSGSGTCAAVYEFSPFGEAVCSNGTYATKNPFRFSTKFTDDETGLVYYGRRYYHSSQGRWLGRDPKEEDGGLHLYGFSNNNGVNRWDYLGMKMVPNPDWHPGDSEGDPWIDDGMGDDEDGGGDYGALMALLGLNRSMNGNMFLASGFISNGNSGTSANVTALLSASITISDTGGITLNLAAINAAFGAQSSGMSIDGWALIPGVTNGRAAEVAWSNGQYGTALAYGTCAMVDAALTVFTFGEYAATRSAMGTTATAVSAAGGALPNGMGIGIVQNGRVIVADLTVATSHEALAADAGVLGANRTLTGGAQAITWTVDNGVIRTVSSINFPSQTGAATEQAVREFLEALARANRGGGL